MFCFVANADKRPTRETECNLSERPRHTETPLSLMFREFV